MMRRILLLLLGWQASALAPLHAAEPRPAETAAAKQPRLNVVFILADDK